MLTIIIGLLNKKFGTDYTALGSGTNAAVAIDDDNFIHVVYKRSGPELIYYTNESGSWVSKIIDSNTTGNSYASIALDDSGNAHVSYTKSDELWYATNSSGNWITTSVDTVVAKASNTAIAVDSSGYAHISYYNAIDKHLKYAANSSGSWVKSTLDGKDNVGKYSDILIVDDIVHIFYSDNAADNIRHMYSY